MARSAHNRKRHGKIVPAEVLRTPLQTPLWELGITELTGHNLETHGREEVNHLLQSGWLLLHIYTLKYPEDGVWRERPMAILGRPRKSRAESSSCSGLDRGKQ
jgi:hypothetical protein